MNINDKDVTPFSAFSDLYHLLPLPQSLSSTGQACWHLLPNSDRTPPGNNPVPKPVSRPLLCILLYSHSGIKTKKDIIKLRITRENR